MLQQTFQEKLRAGSFAFIDPAINFENLPKVPAFEFRRQFDLFPMEKGETPEQAGRRCLAEDPEFQRPTFWDCLDFRIMQIRDFPNELKNGPILFPHKEEVTGQKGGSCVFGIWQGDSRKRGGTKASLRLSLRSNQYGPPCRIALVREL